MLSVGDIVKKSQPSLFWCMRGLSKPKREAIYTLFAFCRHISNILRSKMPAEEKAELIAKTPLNRFGTPREIAELIAFLCEKADFITGQTITADGGFTL